MRHDLQIAALVAAIIILAIGQGRISNRIDRIESRLDQIERLCIDAAAFAPAK